MGPWRHGFSPLRAAYRPLHEMVQNRSPDTRRLRPLSQRGLAEICRGRDANAAPEMRGLPARDLRMPVQLVPLPCPSASAVPHCRLTALSESAPRELFSRNCFPFKEDLSSLSIEGHAGRTFMFPIRESREYLPRHSSPSSRENSTAGISTQCVI